MCAIESLTIETPNGWIQILFTGDADEATTARRSTTTEKGHCNENGENRKHSDSPHDDNLIIQNEPW